MMTTIRTSTLTPQQRAEILHLQTICSGLGTNGFLSNDMNTDPSLPCFFLTYEKGKLVGFLAAFFPTTVEVEVNGFVHPQHRRRGIFSLLVTEAKKTYASQGFLQMLLLVESSSKSGKAYANRRFPHIDHSEYHMSLTKSRWHGRRLSVPKGGTLLEATAEALPQYVRTATLLLKEDGGFIERMLCDPARKGYLYLYEGKPIGVLQQYTEDSGLTMLHAVAIDEAYRGQGHGKAMLCMALERFFISGESISLEVDSQNPRALGLYGDLGFEIDFQIDYHALNLLYL